MGQMGRVNVEGDLETHAEFFAVVQYFLPQVGNNVRLAKKAALGDLVDLFRLARKRFEHPAFPDVRGVITTEDFQKEGLEHMIETGWAVPIDPDTPPEDPEDLYRWNARGYQVKNANKHFHWLVTSKKNGMKRQRRSGAASPSDEAGANRADGGRLSDGELPATAGQPEATIPSPDPSPSLSSNSHTPPRPSGASRLTPLACLWNENRGKLAAVVDVGKKRRQAERARLKEHADLEVWADVIRRIAASVFCTGGGDRGWRADFDFLLKPETYSGVLEGKWGCAAPAREKREPECKLLERFKDGSPMCDTHFVGHPRCRIQLEHERARTGGGPAP